MEMHCSIAAGLVWTIFNASPVAQGDEPNNYNEYPSWPSYKLKALIGLSGPYDIVASVNNFHRRGLDRSVMRYIFNGSNMYHYYSPSRRVRRKVFKKYQHWVPNIFLLHGLAGLVCLAQALLLGCGADNGWFLWLTKLYRYQFWPPDCSQWVVSVGRWSINQQAAMNQLLLPVGWCLLRFGCKLALFKEKPAS